MLLFVELENNNGVLKEKSLKYKLIEFKDRKNKSLYKIEARPVLFPNK